MATPAAETALGQRVVQHGAAHAAAGPAGEPRRRPGTVGAAVEVADPGRARGRAGGRRGRPARRRHRASAPRRTPCRSGRCAARARRRSSPARCGVERRGEADRTAAGHHEVMHRRPPSAARGASAAAGWPAPRSRTGCDGEQRGVEHGEDQRGDPGGVHQRQRDPLDDDGDVVGVAEEPVGPRRHRRQPRHDDHAGVPARAEGGDAPPAQGLGRARRAPASTTPAAAGTSRPADPRLASAPTSSPVCSTTMNGKWPRPVSTPPRSRLHAALRVETTSSATRSRPTSADQRR